MLTSAQFDHWIEALESGKYKQGQKALRTPDDGYCCLGVLADTLGVEWDYDPADQIYFAKFPTGGVMPSYVPSIYVGEILQADLAYFNDGLKYNFHKIADYLEKHRNAFVGTD